MKKITKNKTLSLKLSNKLEDNFLSNTDILENTSPYLYSVFCKKSMSLTKKQQNKSFFGSNIFNQKDIENEILKEEKREKNQISKNIKQHKKMFSFEEEQINIDVEKNIDFRFEEKLPHPIYENRNERKFKSKLVKLKNVSTYLQKIFKNESINIDKMESFEIKILITILERKFNKNLSFRKFGSLIEIKELLKKTLNLFKKQVSKKRVEENNKFIYKFILRRLKLRYINEKNYKNNQESSDLFYSYFFSDLSKKKNLHIIEFHDPLNLKNMKKSLNNKFFQLIFQSERFKNQFLNYHDDYLMEAYQNLLEKKFHKFLIKYEKYFRENKNDAVENIIKNISNSTRIKFPWNKNEISNAMLFFKKNIYKQLNKLHIQ